MLLNPCRDPSSNTCNDTCDDVVTHVHHSTVIPMSSRTACIVHTASEWYERHLALSCRYPNRCFRGGAVHLVQHGTT